MLCVKLCRRLYVSSYDVLGVFISCIFQSKNSHELVPIKKEYRSQKEGCKIVFESLKLNRVFMFKNAPVKIGENINKILIEIDKTPFRLWI